MTLLLSAFAQAHAETLVFRASQPGQQTLDQGEGGGNPFASALIDALAVPNMTLGELPRALSRITESKSRGYQAPQVDAPTANQKWALTSPAPGERRIALVMVVANYERAGVNSLPGAQHDAERVAAALMRAGFETEVALDLDRSAMSTRLAEFGDRSRAFDAAVVYTTGHGVEFDGSIFLLPGDYPIAERAAALNDRAIRLKRVIDAAQARQVNLVFYGGCRDNPFAASQP